MHHVKNDKRALASAQSIYQGLAKLLKTKSYETITVSAICEASNISRATFYRNFDIIEDVLSWYGENMVRNLLNEYYGNPKLQNSIKFSRYAMSYGLKEAEFLEILSTSNKLHLIEATVLKFLNLAPLNIDPSQNPYVKYAISSKVGAFFAIIECWILSGKKESIEQLSNRLEEIEKLAHDTYITFKL